MKKINIILAIVLGMSFSTLIHAQETIKLGTEAAYAPFNSLDKNGKLVGFDIEIGEALCEAMQAKCEWVTSDWDGMIPGLQSKKFDAIVASMSITEERKEKIDFSGKYYTSPVQFAQRKGAGFDVSEKGLKGKKVGVQAGTVTATFVEAKFPKAKMKGYETQDEANLDMLADRVDLLAADSFVLQDFLNSEDGAKFEPVGPAFDDPALIGEGIGIGVRKSDQELRDKLSAAIIEIRKNGTYEKINAKYFPFDVYGSE